VGRTATTALPSQTLPSELCRAELHGEGFAVQIMPFAVYFACTAMSSSPVVIAERTLTQAMYKSIVF
jgi:hypothetical protein